MPIRCDFHFRDEDNSNGQFRLYLPFSLNISEIDTAVSNMKSAVQSISGASLTHVVLRIFIDGDYNSNPSPSADVSSALFITYCDDEGNHEAVFVPFISVSRMEQNGCGAYLRLDEGFPDIPNLISLIRDNFSDAEGRPLGEDYAAGLLIRGQGTYTLPVR